MAETLKKQIQTLCQTALTAFRQSQGVSTEVKNACLMDMAAGLRQNRRAVLKANAKDVAAAKKSNLAAAFVDRLTLNEKRIEEMAVSLEEISRLPDPVGEVIHSVRRPNGLWIHKVRAPIGVIAIIYESRPNVTSDCAGLCFKSGNAVILRGGSESLASNRAVYDCLRQALDKHGLAEGMIQLIETPDRAAVKQLLKMDSYIDVVIPRGGESLIRMVVEGSRIPVIKHYKGICHVYVDEWADLNMAERICFNAKVQRPGVCNAMESMLVHRDVAARFLPGMCRKLMQAGVQIRGDALTCRIVKQARKAREVDYRTEFSDLILAVKVVDSLEQAIEHINTCGSHHSDSIVTSSYEHSLEFMRKVDSACVYTNASTRFTDGFQFGMGAEIGISTDKLHARGPMALEELTTYKYNVFGSGQVRT